MASGNDAPSGDDVESDIDAQYVLIPSWAVCAMVFREGDEFAAYLVGDARGVGRNHVDRAIGPTPRAAMNDCTDVAEGWRRFDVVPK